MSRYIMGLVPIPLLEVLWDKMEPHIQRVVNVAHGEVTLLSVKNRLLTGTSLAVVVCLDEDIVAVNLLEIRVFDSGIRSMYVPVVGGNYMDEWADQFLEIAKAIAKDFNCTELRGLAARKGWTRFLASRGWEEVSIALRCKID